jgi:hypothetical protein
MKYNLWKVVVVMFIMIMSVKMAQAVDNTPPPEALDAAKAAIGAFFGNADQEKLENFGFNNHEEFKNAYIGDGFKVYFLHPGTVLNTIHASSLLSIAIDTNNWQFLILSIRGVACLVTVDYIDNQWIAVSVGGAGLAKQLHEMIQTWPKSDGYEVALIKSLQAKSDFLEVYQDKKQIGIVPLTSVNIALNRANGENTMMLKADDILETLSPVVKQNLIQFGAKDRLK